MPDAREPAASPTPAPASTAAFDAARTEALAFLAGGISHDLANPLGAMLTFASYLAADPRLPADLRDDARLLRAEADKTNRMIRTLLEFARNRPAARTEVSVEAVVAEVLELEDYVLADVAVTREMPRDLPLVLVDPSRLRHLLMVLSVEAIRRLGGRAATGTLGVSARADAARAHVVVAIEFRCADGRAPSSTDGVMDAARGLATELDIDLAVAQTSTGGRFALRLPAATDAAFEAVLWPSTPVPDPAPAVAPGTVEAPPPDGPAPTVLVCDDEETVRTLLVRILTGKGFRVVAAANAAEALALLGTVHVDAVVTDHHMREMSGIELFERATGERPELRSRFVVLSGDPGAEDLVRFSRDAGVTVLAKPFESNRIAATIHAIARA